MECEYGIVWRRRHLLTLDRFRLVACQLEHLRRLRTTRSVKVREQLELLPAELYKMYDMQIEDIDPLDRQQALNLFQFLECAKREVEAEEAAVYIASDRNTFEEVGEGNQRIQFIKELGGSFIRLTNRSKTVLPGSPWALRDLEQPATFVSLAHSTVSQYLRDRFQMATIHVNIARRCLDHLSLNVSASDQFRMFKSGLGAVTRTDDVVDDIIPEGGLDGRRAYEMFFEGWRTSRYPCTKFLEFHYPFGLYAWSNWRAHLEEAGLSFQEMLTIFQSSQALQYNSLWYCIMMMKYWTFKKDQVPAVEYCAALLLCSKLPPWLVGLTRAARCFRQYLTDPALNGEDTSDTASWRTGARPNGDSVDPSIFHSSRDYNMLVGAIEMLNRNDDVDCYGMSMTELKEQAMHTRHWACRSTLGRFCKLLECKLDTFQGGEYVEMDNEFLKAEFVDKLAQFRLPEAATAFIEAYFRMTDLEEKPDFFAKGTKLIRNSFGRPYSYPEQTDESNSDEEAGDTMHSDDSEDETSNDTESGPDEDEANAMRMAQQEVEQKWLEESLKRAWPQTETDRTTSHHDQDGKSTSNGLSEPRGDSDSDWMSTAANKAWHGK